MNKKMSVVTTLYNYVSPVYRSLCRFLPGTTPAYAIAIQSKILKYTTATTAVHTLSTLLYTHMHAHTYQATLTCTHVHTNQGCTEPGAEPPTYTLATSSPIPSYTHLHTHTCTHNKHYHRNGFPQAPISHQSVTASQLLEHLYAILQQNIEACKHTHTHNSHYAHTSHSTLYTHMHTQ